MKQHFSLERARKFIEYVPETGMFRRKRNVIAGNSMTQGAEDHRGYLRVCVAGKTVLAHRLAWLLFYGEWPLFEIDHANGNKKDNRICNIRMCSHQQNNHNQKIRSTNKSGIKGVHFNARASKWQGQVCLNYKIHHVGLFDDLHDAERAVKAKREELHGAFANHG